MVRQMKDELLSFMAKHKFETIDQFKGHSLQFFTTHADLVKRQAEAKAIARANVVKKDDRIEQAELHDDLYTGENRPPVTADVAYGLQRHFATSHLEA